jgi:hypothetical protein
MASSNLDDTDMRLGKPVIAAPSSGSKKIKKKLITIFVYFCA